MPADRAPLMWEVVLPERGATSGMRAAVVVGEEGCQTRLPVPRAVARALGRRRSAGELRPSSLSELSQAVADQQARSAHDRVVRLLDRRDYSTRELRDRLARDGYPPDVAERVVGRAAACGLADDARYADAFIRAKLGGGWGRQRIERELRRRGIEPADVIGWPDDYLSDDDEFDRALALARARRLATTRPYEKLVRHLCGRGFPLGLAARVARQVLDEAAEGEG